MAWVALSFAYKEVLASTKMNQIQTNLNLLVRTDLGGQTITPASAVVGLNIDQNENAIGLSIDSESTTWGIRIYARHGMTIVQDLDEGKGLVIQRDIAEAGVSPLVKFLELNTSGTQAVLKITHARNGSCVEGALRVENLSTDRAAIEGSGVAAGVYGEGTTYDFSAPGPFTTKNGYVQAKFEALAWDVVEINIDQASPESIAYALDGLKCMGMQALGFDVNLDRLDVTTDIVSGYYTRATHDGANLTISYGGSYVNDDDLRAIIFIKL